MIKKTIGLWGVCLCVVILASCAYTPEDKAFKYWTLRAQLKTSAAGYVESNYRSRFREEIKAARLEMESTFPDLSDYTFDFSGLNASVVAESEMKARVSIKGRAKVFDSAGELVDDSDIHELVELKNDGGWVVVYDKKNVK